MPDLFNICEVYRRYSNDYAWLYDYLQYQPVSGEDPVTVRLLWADDRATESAFRSETVPVTQKGRSRLNSVLFRDTSSLRAVVLCHGQSADVDRKLLALLAERLELEPAFIRQHLDYKNFHLERNCRAEMAQHFQTELMEYATYGDEKYTMRWNPVRLPSESSGTVLKLCIEDDCMSFCLRYDIAVVFIRSVRTCKAEHWMPGVINARALAFQNLGQRYLSSIDSMTWNEKDCHPYIWVYQYARLLLLEYYADHMYLHHPDYLTTRFTRYKEHLLQITQSRSQLEGLYQDLSTLAQSEIVLQCKESRIQQLGRDAQLLLKRYDRVYEYFEQGSKERTKSSQFDVMAEQLDEARESKMTAISVGRLSKLAFIFIPPTFVCTMLGMNLAVFGQGTIPIAVFFVLLVAVSLFTFLPIAMRSSAWRKRISRKAKGLAVIFKLAWRSPVAAFWYAAFVMCHTGGVNVYLRYSGIWQALDRQSYNFGNPATYRRQLLECRISGERDVKQFWKDLLRWHVFPLLDELGWERRSFISRNWQACLKTAARRQGKE